MGTVKISLFTIFICLTPLISHSQSQVLVHPDCAVNTTNLDFDDPFKFISRTKEALKQNGYRLVDFPKMPKAYKGMLYVKIGQWLEGGKLYPDCSVELTLFQASETSIHKNDKKVFSQKAKRSFPRISRKGKRRCQLALKDILLKLPKCESMKAQ